MSMFCWLPVLSWASSPFTVVVVLAVAVVFLRWLPEQLHDIYDNWRDLARKFKGEDDDDDPGTGSGADQR